MNSQMMDKLESLSIHKRNQQLKEIFQFMADMVELRLYAQEGTLKISIIRIYCWFIIVIDKLHTPALSSYFIFIRIEFGLYVLITELFHNKVN